MKHTFCLSSLGSWSLPVITLVGCWFFAAWLYGDVFYMAAQYSFFSFEEEAMHFVREQPGGWFYVVGRFLLCLFHEPWLGGFVWALLLAGSVCLFQYGANLRGKYEWLSVLPVCLVGLGFLHRGLNLYYQSEPSWVFLVPLALFAGMFLLALGRFFFLQGAERGRGNAFSCIMAVVLFFSLGMYAWWGKENERLTASLQRDYLRQDWQSMQQTARKASHPTRAVAAYHAIAWVHSGQLLNHWLDIPYQYPDLGLVDWGGLPDDGSDLYYAEACLTAGLVYPAYHQAMERMVIEGPSCYTLKLLTYAALLNGEYALANKYLYQLSQHPFEGAFVRRYGAMVAHPERVWADPYFHRVLELAPMTDSFEQAYRAPLFIGYNVQTNQVRSAAALEVSLAACLYAKQLSSVVQRAQVYRGKQLPAVVEQAIALYALEHPEVLAHFQVRPQVVQEVHRFVQQYVSQPPKDIESLRETYRHFYPFYYYYQNQVDETQWKRYQPRRSGGVN